MSGKVRKPRTATERFWNKFLEKNGNKSHCPYDDGTRGKECMYPWSTECDGDIFKCNHLKYHHNASLGPDSGDKKDFV